jgi:hypothetical protein
MRLQLGPVVKNLQLTACTMAQPYEAMMFIYKLSVVMFQLLLSTCMQTGSLLSDHNYSAGQEIPFCYDIQDGTGPQNNPSNGN